MNPGARYAGRLDGCLRLLEPFGLSDVRLDLCAGSELLVTSHPSTAPDEALARAIAHGKLDEKPIAGNEGWITAAVSLGPNKAPATLWVSATGYLPSRTVVRTLVDTIEHDWSQYEALESLSVELGNRYEELNLLYGIDNALNLDPEAPLTDLVRESLQACIDLIEIDAASVWAPKYDLAERAFTEPDGAMPSLVTDKLGVELMHYMRGRRGACVLNGEAGDPLSEAGLDLPFRVVIAPIAQGTRPLAGVLMLSRTFANAPFTNSDRKLAVVLAAEIGKALDHRFDSVTGLMNRETFERTVLDDRAAERHETCNSLAHIDIDQFKLINDTCGHEAGASLPATVLTASAENFRLDARRSALKPWPTVPLNLVRHVQSAYTEHDGMNHSLHSRSRIELGFTLVELLIVVIILAILAAIVVPQFSAATDDAKLSALDTTLANMRASIDLYYQQHGKYPGDLTSIGAACAAGPAGTTGTGAADLEAAFLDQLAFYTDVAGESCTKSDAAFKFGPYLKKRAMPENPFTGVKTVAMSTTGALGMLSTVTDGGWKYDTTTGQFIADHTAYDDR